MIFGIPSPRGNSTNIGATAAIIIASCHSVRDWLLRHLGTMLKRVVVLLQGHKQREHETSHGSMTQTRWAVDGPDGTSLELGGRKFTSNDEGAPMMCNLVCSSLGRHVHIDYCRSGGGGTCRGAEVQHLGVRRL